MNNMRLPIFILCFFIPFFGIAQVWSEVKVGETDIVTICKGTDTIWEKPNNYWTYEGIILSCCYIECSGDPEVCDSVVWGWCTPEGDCNSGTVNCNPYMIPEPQNFTSITYYYGYNILYLGDWGNNITEYSNITDVSINGISYNVSWSSLWSGWICSTSNPFLNYFNEEISIKIKYTP
jgi:hypothetical protein